MECLHCQDHVWNVVLFFDAPTLMVAATLNRLWSHIISTHKGISWKLLAYHQFPHLRITHDASGYYDDWERLCRDGNRRNRSAVFRTRIPYVAAMDDIGHEGRQTKFLSDPFVIGAYSFSLLVYPYGNTRYTSSAVSVYLQWNNPHAITQFLCTTVIQLRILNPSSSGRHRTWRSSGKTLTWRNTSWGRHELLQHECIQPFLRPPTDTHPFPTLEVEIATILLYVDLEWYDTYEDWDNNCAYQEPSRTATRFIGESVLSLRDAVVPEHLSSVWVLSVTSSVPRLIVDLDELNDRPIWNVFSNDMHVEERRLRLCGAVVQHT